MKTASAINTHLVLGLSQAAAGAWIHSWWGQIVVQASLLIVQGVVAHVNSHSMPNGDAIEEGA